MCYKVISLFSFLILAVSSYAQVEDIPQQEVDPNGYNKFYYPDGSIASEGYLVDGKPDGYWISYHENGNIKSEGTRRLFMLDSTWSFYFPDGALKKKIDYRNDKRNGYTITYDYYFDADSVKNYYKKSKILYLNGVKQGKAFYYNKNSKLQFSFHYRNGQRHGVGKEYDEEGEVISLFNYHSSYLINRTRINRYDSESRKTGKWITFYDNGNKHIEKHYLAGELNGEYIEYDRQGNIIASKYYRDDEIYTPDEKEEEEIQLKAEVKTTYHSSGRIKFQGAFIDTIPVGIHREFDEDGEIKSSKEYNRAGDLIGVGQFDENGLRTGKWKLYDSYHNYFYAEGYYSEGKKDQMWVFYFPDMSIEQTGMYLSGRPEGEWTWYYNNGNVRKIENYVNGKLEGDYIEYGTEEQIIAKGEYFDGAKEGEWVYNTGNVRITGVYEFDNKHGEWKHTDNTTGNTLFQGNFVNGEPDGVHKHYFPNGRVKLLAGYRMGNKHNNWRHYDIEGSLFLTQTYENNRLVRIDGRSLNINID